MDFPRAATRVPEVGVRFPGGGGFFPGRESSIPGLTTASPGVGTEGRWRGKGLGARRLCPAARSRSFRCPFMTVTGKLSGPVLLRAGGAAHPGARADFALAREWRGGHTPAVVADTQIIFLLSMPRAGSTLLQRLLMGSGVCKTVGEPSFLLRLLGDGDPILRAATYSEALVETAIKDMRSAWDGFDGCWRKGVHDLAVSVYDGLAGGAPFFIDKTPRYSLIAEDLLEIFPEAKFIVLWRHPLAVANSLSTTFREGRWEQQSFEMDLIHGMDQLRSVCEKHGPRIHQVKYEDLAADPAKELATLGAYLGIPDLAAVADRELEKGNHGQLGDPTGVKKYSKVSAKSISEWEDGIRNWFREGWVKKYFSGERAEFFRTLGYELPQRMKDGKVPLGLIDGVRDWLYTRRIVNRRLLRPLGSKRRLRKQGKKRGYLVAYR